MFKLLFPDIKMLFRNKQASFWALMFPLMFTFIFGFFFGKDSNTGKLIVINSSDSEIATSLVSMIEDSNTFQIISDVDNVDAAKDEVQAGDAVGALIIPEKFGAMVPDAPRELTVVVDPANATTNGALTGILNAYNTQLTFKLNNVTETAFKINEEKTNTKDLSYFDFVLAGILGLALMNASIIGISVGMSKYREDKIFKRLTTTPMKPWWFIVNEVLSRLVLNFIQISIILLIGKYVFDAHIYGNIFIIYGLALLGAILFQLIGFAIASFVKTTDAAQGAATAITIPMMFLGGVFFPIDGLPKWLLAIVEYLPIAPFLRMMRDVVLEGASPFRDPMNITIVLAWILVCLVISARRFKLGEE